MTEPRQRGDATIDVVLHLADTGPATVQQVAAATGLHYSTVSKVLTKLCKGGHAFVAQKIDIPGPGAKPREYALSRSGVTYANAAKGTA